MSQSRGIIEVLKKTAKAKGITYRDLARRMGRSEVTVKRIFSDKKLTLDRLEEICSILGITLSEVTERAAEETRAGVDRLTFEQEKALAADPKLFSLFYLVATHLEFNRILKAYDYERAELTKYMVQLDRLGILDLLPNNKYKMKSNMNIRWIVNGPLIRRYSEEIKSDYMSATFTGSGEFFHMYHAYLSETSYNLVRKSLERVTVDMQQLSDVDEATAKKARRISFVVSGRPWTFSIIDRYRRRPD